jgi:predicted nucleotidyltransferase component of viral defense system
LKQEAIKTALRVVDASERLNVLREYLQVAVLRSLHESQTFKSLSFVGGTALRFLHGLPRFSEDLDFSLEAPTEYQPESWLGKVKRDLERQGFDAELSWNEMKTVQVAWIKLSGILEEAGIAARKGQKLSIKLEMDTCPPAGAVLESSIVHRHIMFAVRHHDLSSLFAGKVRAIVTQPLTKGRDWYDLLWYRSRKDPVEPNPVLLKSSLAQAGMQYHGDWRQLLWSKLEILDVDTVRADVEPFLEHNADTMLLSRENLEKSLA